MAEFIRCECGTNWRHTINMLDGKPIWCPPKAKRNDPCKHRVDQAEALIDGEWIRAETGDAGAHDATSAEAGQ